MTDNFSPEVRCGKTDGFRYIAFQPPLNEHNLRTLSKITTFSVGAVEHVKEPLSEACTMIQYSTELEFGISHPDILLSLARGLSSYFEQEGKKYSLASEEIAHMGWGQSSPFNSYPQQNQ